MNKESHIYRDDPHFENEQQRQYPHNQWKVAFGGLKNDLREFWSPGNILTLILLFLAPAIGLIMNTQQYVIYGAAFGVTILIWWVAFRLASHANAPAPQESIGLVQSKADSTAARPTVTVSPPAKIKSEPPRSKPKEVIPDLPIEKLSFVSKPISSPNEQLPFALEVTIQTNVTINSPHIRIECDGEIKDAKFRFIGVAAMLSIQTTISKNSYDFSCGYPPFTPQNPLVITLFSESRINVLKVYHVL